MMAVFQQSSDKIPEVLTLSSHESVQAGFGHWVQRRRTTLSVLEEDPNSEENTRLLSPTFSPPLAGEEP